MGEDGRWSPNYFHGFLSVHDVDASVSLPPRRSKLNENPSIGDAFGKNTADLAGACIHCLSFKTVGRKGCHQPIAHSSLIQAFL